jgi:hypothetical protein
MEAGLTEKIAKGSYTSPLSTSKIKEGVKKKQNRKKSKMK